MHRCINSKEKYDDFFGRWDFRESNGKKSTYIYQIIENSAKHEQQKKIHKAKIFQLSLNDLINRRDLLKSKLKKKHKSTYIRSNNTFIIANLT